MKKCSLLFAASLLILGTSWGCGPSWDDWDQKVKEAEDLEMRIADLEKTYEARVQEIEQDNEAMIKEIGKLEKTVGSLEKLADKLDAQKAQAKERLAMISDMLAKFKSLIEAGKLKVRIRDGKMLLELPSAVLFRPGKATLRKPGRETLEEIAPVLASFTEREFQVAGHTDDQPIKVSEFSTNWELSVARAVEVVRFLQESGVPAESLSAAGYSMFQPVEDNSTWDGKKANRRIEIVVVPNLEELPDLGDLESILE